MARLEDLPADHITSGPAALVWPLEKSGSFSVRSMRRALVDERFPGEAGFPFDSVWVNYAPPKTQVFCWLAFHKKFATVDNLQRRGLHLANRCVMCYSCSESVDHLLLQCDFSSSVWATVCSRLSIFGPLPFEVREFVSTWKDLNCLASFSDAMKVLMHATFWCLWIERNNRIFREQSKTVNQIAVKILISVGRWLSAAGVFSLEKQNCWNRFTFDPG
ncbi:Putative ribonuclease H protein At1g65750 [Linum grandiflorum]